MDSDHTEDPCDGPTCTKCGVETITDPKGICYDCWAAADLEQHERELAKKNSDYILDATGNSMVDVDKSTNEDNLLFEEE